MTARREPPGAVLAGACRTPLAPRNGALGGWHPADLLAALLHQLVEGAGLDPAEVGDVVVGCATAIGAQAMNVGRQAVLAAGWPETVPGLTLDRQGASGLDAVAYAVAAVEAGLHDVVVAAGVEAMTLVPAGAAVQDGSFGLPFGPTVQGRYRKAGGLLPAGLAADAAAMGLGLSRDDLDGWALASHRRAESAAGAGRWAAEVVAVEERRLDREVRRAVVTGRTVKEDATLDFEVTAASLAAYKPAHAGAGLVTAGNSAPMADGAAAVLVLSEARAAALGVRPLTRLAGAATCGVSPASVLDAPVLATERVLARIGVGVDAVECFEVDETFAAVPLGWLRRFPAVPAERVNPSGGAIALGQPLGAGGLRALVSLAHRLAGPGPGPGGLAVAPAAPAGVRLGLVAAGLVGGVATAVVVATDGADAVDGPW